MRSLWSRAVEMIKKYARDVEKEYQHLKEEEQKKERCRLVRMPMTPAPIAIATSAAPELDEAEFLPLGEPLFSPPQPPTRPQLRVIRGGKPDPLVIPSRDD